MSSRLTPYCITRGHQNKTGFYIIFVPETFECGLGFQVNVRGTLYGLSWTSRQQCSTNRFGLKRRRLR